MDEQRKGWTVPEIKTFALFVITAPTEHITVSGYNTYISS